MINFKHLAIMCIMDEIIIPVINRSNERASLMCQEMHVCCSSLAQFVFILISIHLNNQYVCIVYINININIDEMLQNNNETVRKNCIHFPAHQYFNRDYTYIFG